MNPRQLKILAAAAIPMLAMAAEAQAQIVAETGTFNDLTFTQAVSTGSDRGVLEIDHDTTDESFTFDIGSFPDVSAVGENHVFAMGWNMGASSAVDATQPGFGLAFERNFANPGTPAGFEFHLQSFAPDGTNRRPLSFFIPRDGSPETAAALISTSTMRFADYDQNVILQMNLMNRTFDFNAGAALRFDVNGSPTIYQRNAAGTSFLPNIYIDSFDNLRGDLPLTINGAFKATALGPHSLAGFQGSGAKVGSIGLYLLSSSDVNGTYDSFRFDAYALRNIGRMVNLRTGGSNDIRLESTSGENRMSMFDRVTGRGFAMGMAANGDWVLQTSMAALGLNPYIMRYSRSAATFQFGTPVQLASFGSASLPSASQVGAGTLVWVQPLSGNGYVAYSDGSSWRQVADGGSTASQTAPASQSAAPQATDSVPTASASDTSRPADTTLTLTTDEDAAASEDAGASPPVASTDPAADPVRSVASTSFPTQSVTMAEIDELSARVGTLEGQVADLGYDLKRANGGIAAAMALGGTMMPPDTNVALSANVATFRGEQGFSVSGVARVGRKVWINGGIAGSTAKGSTGARAGATIGW